MIIANSFMIKAGENDTYYYINIAGNIGRLNVKPPILKRYINKEFHYSNPSQEPKYKMKIHIQSSQYVIYDESHDKYHFLNRVNSYLLQDIDFLIRAHLANLCLNDDIVFLHGSALVKNNKSYIFIGPSGAGKTTITKKVPKSFLLSDDTAVIKKIGKHFFIYSSPFDKPSVQVFSSKKFPVEKIFILNQSPDTKITPEPFDKKLCNVVNNCIFSLFDENKNGINNERRKFNSLILKLFSNIKIERLYFTKDLNVFEYL